MLEFDRCSIGWNFLCGAALCLIVAGCHEVTPEPTTVPIPLSSKSFETIQKEANCMACHLQGNQMGAPTWSEVAKRYKGNKNMAVYLAHKIAHGGSGAWGAMDMPPYHELSDAELTTLVTGILASNSKSKSPN